MDTRMRVDTKLGDKKMTHVSENEPHVVGSQKQLERWRWTPGKVYHWVLSFCTVAYALWRFATTEQKDFLLDHMRSSFDDSPFGLKQKQLVPVFYSVYSSLFVASTFGWEVTLLFLAQHAAFYVTASLGSPALCYVAAAAIHCQKFFLPFDPYVTYRRLVSSSTCIPRYGEMAYMAAYVAFHWNVLRGLSFSVDFVQAERRKNTGVVKRRWPPYWKTLGYMSYLPTVYMGPPLKYDDYTAQSEQPKPSCTLRDIAGTIAMLLRNGAHYVLMELMAHFFYSSAMSNWYWMADRLDFASLVGYALALEFHYYVSYLFQYGFAGSLASVEGIKVPATAPCIARLHRCSRFWRYFDRGMHLWIRRYIYEPVMGGHSHCLPADSRALCALGIALEVITIQIRKWTPVKKFEKRYLASPEKMRRAKALLGAPHFLLTICACLFHLAELPVCVNICRRILTGFPFPMLPIMVVMYSLCHVSMDIEEWEEASAMAKRKQASS
ncbi:hypothetical protein MTO96_007133 [Rhipicephalus appendiculatus]